jgi:hypothetical protein
MKFYNYKNGEIAFFENDKRMLISKEEKDMLVTGTNVFNGHAEFSPVYDYIEKKIEKSKFCACRFSLILEEYRRNTYTKECKTINIEDKEFNVEIYRENAAPIVLKVFTNDFERIAIKGEIMFNDAISEFKALDLI